MVFRNVFGIVIPFTSKDISKKAPKLTFSVIQDWIFENYNEHISKSSISMVKQKCGIEKLEFGCKAKRMPQVKTENEKKVLEAFRYFEII